MGFSHFTNAELKAHTGRALLELRPGGSAAAVAAERDQLAPGPARSVQRA